MLLKYKLFIKKQTTYKIPVILGILRHGARGVTQNTKVLLVTPASAEKAMSFIFNSLLSELILPFFASPCVARNYISGAF